MRDPLLEDEENRAHSNGLHDEHDEREDSEASDDDEAHGGACGRSTGYCAALLLGVTAFTGLTAMTMLLFRGSLFDGPAPSCRKGMAFMAVDENTFFAFAGTGRGGMQRGNAWVFDKPHTKWIEELDMDGGVEGGAPAPRWKAVGLSFNNSVLLMGGDPENKTAGYLNDLWVARPRSVSPGSNSAKVQWAWTSMDVPAASGLLRSGEDAPVGRRAHAGAVMEVDGVHYLYVHGGRAQSKLVGCLGDVWRVALGQEGAAWEREWAGDEDGHQPQARKGHSMVPVPGLTKKAPSLVVYGGRNDTAYFGDVWAFNVRKRRWTVLHDGSGQQDEAVPSPRDHHSVSVHLSQMVVFGGRYGEEHQVSYPLDDMWKFDVHLHVWRRIVFSDDVDTPAARFLHGAAQMDGSDNMYIFGGQLSTEVTLDTPEDKELRANDVWVFNFGETQWTRLFASTCLARGQ